MLSTTLFQHGIPISPRSDDRVALLGIEGSSITPGAGQVMTPRDYACGEFRDGFDWASLSLAYRERIGVRDA
jgi:hypothetical protein